MARVRTLLSKWDVLCALGLVKRKQLFVDLDYCRARGVAVGTSLSTSRHSSGLRTLDANLPLVCDKLVNQHLFSLVFFCRFSEKKPARNLNENRSEIDSNHRIFQQLLPLHGKCTGFLKKNWSWCTIRMQRVISPFKFFWDLSKCCFWRNFYKEIKLKNGITMTEKYKKKGFE